MTAPDTNPPATDATQSQLFTYQLDNGLQILGQRMPELESVSVCFFARTGARDEHDPALFGISHFLEHMVFKGTARRDTEQITLDFNRIGAEFNAFTSVEQTVYYARILGEYLPDALDLLSDMMRPRLDAEDFAMERNVILEEIARSEDVPTSQAYRKLMQTYFSDHALGHDVLGTRDSIGAMQVEQMREYAARRYAANNLILAVAGNFEWDRVLDLAREKCGGWQRGEQGRQVGEHLPQPAHNVVVKPQQKQQIMLLGWPSVSEQDPDLYAAHLASMILGDGTGSRLYWNIYQKGLAESVGTGLNALDGTGMMMAVISTTPDQAPNVLDMVRTELQHMQQGGIAEDELQRAKDKLISSTVLNGDSAFSRMQDLAYTWVAKHEVQSIQDEMALIEHVQVADIRRVLDRYPLTERHVLVTYGPLEASAFGV